MQPEEDTFIARTRHLDAMKRTQQYLVEAREQLVVYHAGELVAESLRLAQNAFFRAYQQQYWLLKNPRTGFSHHHPRTNSA